MFIKGILTISCSTLIMPQSICREADMIKFTARFPYIIVLMAPRVEVPDDISIEDDPNSIRQKSVPSF
jgi:hypothetical protein